MIEQLDIDFATLGNSNRPSRHSRHADCKDSRVSWLPSIPSRWNIKRLKFAVTFPAKAEVRNLPLDRMVSFVPMDAVGEYGGLRLDEARPLEEVLNGYTFFRNGDVVLAKITPCFENGKGALASDLEGGIGFGTTELHVMRAGKELLPEYLFYLTTSRDFRELGTAEMYGAGGQKRVPERFLRDLRHPLPPRDEQRVIVSFLDKETTRIDRLIADKTRLIELLDEKRSAVITLAVTRGLNPNVATTKCDLLGTDAIPVHWHVKQLGHVTRIGNGSTPDRENSEYWDGGVHPWLNSSVVNLPGVYEASDFVTDAATRECHLPLVAPGSVLVGITGEGKTRGMATLLHFPATINQHLAFLTPRRGVADGRFIRWTLQSCYQALRLTSDGAGSTKGAITCHQLAHFKVPLPPMQEQLAICDYLEAALPKLDRLKQTVNEVIARLREYRSSLVTAAVTGRIDVRGKEMCS